jgi:alpha-glucosidase (family GH31 glycosyl hydrolase)
MIRKFGIIIFLIHLISIAEVSSTEKKDQLIWGTGAVRIGPAHEGTVSLQRLLTEKRHVLVLDKFYRAGGEGLPAEPTECRMAYNADTLYVAFRCTESNMQFPAISHQIDWYSQLYSATEQDACFPDKVDFFLLPDMNKTLSYQVAVTKDGQTFGNKVFAPFQEEQAFTDEKKQKKSVRFDDFKASVIPGEKEWIAFIRIPWSAVGGKPAAYCGINPVRTRWRNAEISSPVAMDFTERPTPDLFIEALFSNKPQVYNSKGMLCQLPSGTLRWQRPALLTYPDQETVREIWGLQQHVPHPTDQSNLARRIYLVQRWIDLLTLEGFNFGSTRGCIGEEDMYPFDIRIRINQALHKKNMDEACRLLDGYLYELDQVSRKWFADGSPGNILDQEWHPVRELKNVEIKDNFLIMHCMVANRIIDLHLSLPKSGGIRLYAGSEGYFKPDSLSSLNLKKEPGKYLIGTDDGRIAIEENPFKIIFYDTADKEIMQIDPADIAFRIDPDGKIAAVDFKNRLGRDEVIYGFGEKYDRFNQNGNVLTLWGMDDWTGLTVGLRNQSYKPIPLLHSSKGYMVFINSSYRLRVDVGKTRQDQYRLTQHGPVFDYYLWFSSPPKALQSYTALTGKPVLPPKWAFEPWMGRTGRGWINTPLKDPVTEQKRVTLQFEKLDIPHSAIYAEGIGANTPELYAFMAPRGIRVLSWFYSSIPQKEQERLMPEKRPDELPVLKTDIAVPSKNIGYVDFTHPEAKELSRRWWKLRLDLGVSGSMVDFGDRVPEDAVFYDGRKGDEMHNFYTYDYHRTYSEIFKERRGDDFILFGRAAAPGTQKWVGQFPGDHPSNFAGLRGVLTGALNLTACGFSAWGSDLGGFRGWPESEVYIRWTQFACFSPLMRCHGRTPREPWEFGEAAVANYKHYAWVRENLLNYIYNAAVQAHHSGIPMMRSMAIAYPEESLLANVSDQYLFGNDLLVAPVITENKSRTISFPSGKWTSLWTGDMISGPGNIQTEVPLQTIPVYLKEGAVVPVRLNGDLQFGESMTRDQVNALIVTPPKGKEEVSLLNAENETASVNMQSVSDTTFRITMKNFPEMIYLIVYNTGVTGIKVNGQPIPALKEEERSSHPPGWYSDPTADRVVIRLPRDVAQEVEIRRTKN